MKNVINAKHLKAALCCASVQDIRQYLNGVFIEVARDEIRVVSTDGHVAAVLRTTNLLDENDGWPFEVIVPSEAVKLALAGKAEALELSRDGNSWKLGAINFTPIDGKFPDYRRIIPARHSGEAAQFATDKIAQFAKVGKALGRRDNPIIRHSGDGGAQVQFYGEHDFVGVIMPLRVFNQKCPDTGLEQWGSERAK